MTVKSTILPGAGDRKPFDAKKSVTITITEAHHKNAIQCDGKNCVVAQACDDSNIGEVYEGVEVGLSVTKISYPGKILRYATPKELAPYIREFDKTGAWNEKAIGEFIFKPLPPTMRLGARPNRWAKHRTNTDGSGRDGKMCAIPTRRISRVKTAA